MSGRLQETGLEGLYASAPEPLPFAPSLHIRAFILRRDDGNLLVYSVTGLASHAGALDELGGVQRQYLNHWHEAMFVGDGFEVPLYVHENDRGRHRVLFTGDTIYVSNGEWVAAVLESSDRAAYADSLELIRELDFDVLVPWAATAGDPYYAVTAPGDRRRRIDAVLERVRRGRS